MSYHLGASLYVPAIRDDLLAIASGTHYSYLRSVIFCTEDSIREEETSLAIHKLDQMLKALKPTSRLSIFIRVRNQSVLARLLRIKAIHKIDGFVLPKVTIDNIDEYINQFASDDDFQVMPTLETIEVFDPQKMRLLRDHLQKLRNHHRILTLRIGGNDLLNILGMRRPSGRTIYDGVLGTVIPQLATVFLPHGFNLTGPVFESLIEDDVLIQEVHRDLEHGLSGKTAIHPRQIPLIEGCYKVEHTDYEMAEHLLHQDSPAVFRMHNKMCEKTTHERWAKSILARTKVYGMRQTLNAPMINEGQRS